MDTAVLHTDVPVARRAAGWLLSAVSPLRKLPLAENSHLAQGHASFPGQLLAPPQLGTSLPQFRAPCLVDWDLCWVLPGPNFFLCLVLHPSLSFHKWSSWEQSLINLPYANLHLTVCFLGSLMWPMFLDLFPSPWVSSVFFYVSFHFSPSKSVFEIFRKLKKPKVKNLLAEKDLINSFLLRCNRPTIIIHEIFNCPLCIDSYTLVSLEVLSMVIQSLMWKAGL